MNIITDKAAEELVAIDCSPRQTTLDQNKIKDDDYDEKIGLNNNNDSKIQQINYIKLWPSILAVVVACLPSLNAGYAIGFSSPATRDFEAGTDELKLTDDQITWHGSLLNLFIIAGSFICGPLMDVIGRKLAINCSILFFVIAWTLTALSTSVGILLVGRCTCGFAYGMGIAATSVYLGEVGPVFIRGILGTLVNILMSFGILIGIIFGTFLKWRNLAQIGGCVACISFVCSGMLPESPFWLLRRYFKSRNKTKIIHDIVKALTSLSVENPKIVAIRKLREIKNTTKVNFQVRQLCNSIFYKPLVVVVTLNVSQQLSGICVVFYYMHSLFKVAHEGIAPISVGTINLLAMVCSMLLIDRIGRRKLMLISSLGAAFSLVVLGLSMYLNETGVANGNKTDSAYPKHSNLSSNPTLDDYGDEVVKSSSYNSILHWISLISALLYIIFYGLGLGPIAFVSVGEMIPLQGRGFAGGVATATNGLSAFLIIKLFPRMSEIVPVSAMFIGFGICCVGVAAFVYWFMPETKGKTLQEIQQFFAPNKSHVLI